MPYLVLGIALAIGLILIGRGVSQTNPKVVLSVLKWAAAVAGAASLLFLTVEGRGGIALAVALVLGPALLRWRALSRMARSWRGPRPGQSSDVETRYLRMSLDHDSGALHGLVIDGRFRGSRLDELSLAQLIELLRECRLDDAASVSVLEAYIDRVHGPGWRTSSAGDTGAMSRAEAYEILGLAPGASPERIKEAHRRLMRQHHPDHGGSTFFAARINQAKDLLLDQ